MYITQQHANSQQKYTCPQFIYRTKVPISNKGAVWIGCLALNLMTKENEIQVGSNSTADRFNVTAAVRLPAQAHCTDKLHSQSCVNINSYVYRTCIIFLNLLCQCVSSLSTFLLSFTFIFRQSSLIKFLTNVIILQSLLTRNIFQFLSKHNYFRVSSWRWPTDT